MDDWSVHPDQKLVYGHIYCCSANFHLQNPVVSTGIHAIGNFASARKISLTKFHFSFSACCCMKRVLVVTVIHAWKHQLNDTQLNSSVLWRRREPSWPWTPVPGSLSFSTLSRTRTTSIWWVFALTWSHFRLLDFTCQSGVMWSDSTKGPFTPSYENNYINTNTQYCSVYYRHMWLW